MNKQTVIAALERLKDGTKGVVAATISDCQRVICAMDDDSGWISVDDRPPEPGVPVFLKSQYGTRAGYLVHRKWKNFFMIEEVDGLYRGGTATHWAPMPEEHKENAR